MIERETERVCVRVCACLFDSLHLKGKPLAKHAEREKKKKGKENMLTPGTLTCVGLVSKLGYF